MARTKTFAIEGRNRDDPLPPRVPKKETTILNENLPVHHAASLCINAEEEWSVVDYYDEATNNHPETQLKWITAEEEEFQKLWVEMIRVSNVSPSMVQFICEHMNELNCFYGLWMTGTTAESILKLVECFLPEAVFISNFDHITANYELPGDLLVQPCFKDLKRFHVMDKRFTDSLNLGFMHSGLTKIDVYQPTSCVFNLEPISRTLRGWAQSESPIIRIRLEFNQQYNTTETLPLILEGVPYTVDWKYSEHDKSMVREFDINEVKRLENAGAVLVILKQEMTRKTGVLLLDSTGVFFTVFEAGEFEKFDHLNVRGILCSRCHRLLCIEMQ